MGFLGTSLQALWIAEILRLWAVGLIEAVLRFQTDRCHQGGDVFIKEVAFKLNVILLSPLIA
jgi:hypothetical protein